MKKHLVAAILFSLAVATYELDPSQCLTPLGMENGMIKDEYITSSSSFDHENVGPHHGRIRNELHGGAWCPLTPATPDLKEWIEIDLQDVFVITATGTQGRFGNGQGVEFTESYILEYWRPSLNKWMRYHNRTGNEVMKGNMNTYLESKTHLDPPIWASKIRFLPFSYHHRTVCMRVEVYGCRWSEGLLSYSMPQGDKRGNNWEFYDVTYDGQWSGDQLRYGLGQLIDGKVGPDDFKVAFHNLNLQGWVGWKNDLRKTPIEIVFEFEKVREFNAIHIYCNNQFTKDVRVFAEARVFFSVTGKKYMDEPITYNYIEDLIFETPRNVSIKLHHRVGKMVKIQLHFASRWMLVSEITFESAVMDRSFSETGEQEEINILDDQISTPGITTKNDISAVNAQEDIVDYLGVVAGLLVVLLFFVIAAVAAVVIRQMRSKTSSRSSQVPIRCDKAVLYQESNAERYSRSSDYADIKDCEYAVPLQPTLQDYCHPLPLLSESPLRQSPSEHYYAATEICNAGFIPPPPPLSTPPSLKLGRQPKYYVSSTSKMHIGP